MNNLPCPYCSEGPWKSKGSLVRHCLHKHRTQYYNDREGAAKAAIKPKRNYTKRPKLEIKARTSFRDLDVIFCPCCSFRLEQTFTFCPGCATNIKAVRVALRFVNK